MLQGIDTYNPINKELTNDIRVLLTRWKTKKRIYFWYHIYNLLQ